MDRTMLDPRTSVESDASNLSYPSQEPSLLDQLRTSLSQGADINKILNKRKHRKDMTINFSLSSSPGSLNSSANVTLPRERRQANVLKSKKKSDMTMNFTMNDTASSCDNQENESPVLSSNKPVFKKPFAKKMSIDIDDIPESDSSKNSIHDDSLPALDTKSRKLPLKSSMRSKADHDKNVTINISLDSSENGDESIDQASLADGGKSSSVSDEILNHDESQPKLESKRLQPSLMPSRSRAPLRKKVTSDISGDSSIESEKSIEQALANDAVPSSSSANSAPLYPKVSVSPGIEGISMNSSNDHLVQNDNHTSDAENGGNESKFEVTSTSATNYSMKSSYAPVRIIDQTFTCDTKGNGNSNPVLDSSAGLEPIPSSNEQGPRNDQTSVTAGNANGTSGHEVSIEKSCTNSITDNPVTINDLTFVVDTATPQESVIPSAHQGTPQSEETPMKVDGNANVEADSPAPKASTSNPATPTRGTTVSHRKSVRLLSEETVVDGTPHTNKRSPNSADDTNSVVQLDTTKVRLQPQKNLTDSANRSTSSKLDEEPTTPQHSNKLKGQKNRISVNFTLSDTAHPCCSTDSNITLPKILERTAEPLLKKKNNKISIPIRLGDDDTLPSTTHADDQEGDSNMDEDLDYGDASLIPSPSSSSSHGANKSNISSPVMMGKHNNPLAKRSGSNKVSIPCRFDDTVNDDGSPSTSATDEQRKVDAEANDEDNTSFLLHSGKCANPLPKRCLERNKFSIPCKLEDTVTESESSNIGITGDDTGDCVVDANEHSEDGSSCENANASNPNPENFTEDVGNPVIAVPDVASNVTQSSDAVSLGCSLDDVPRSSNDYSCDSLKSFRKISVQPQETSNVSKGMSPSVEGHPGVAFSPERDVSSDGLHLELSLNESLKYSGMDSSASSIKSQPDTDAKHPNSSLKIDDAEAAKDMNLSVSTNISQDSPSLTMKSSPLLRRSKRGLKNVTIGADLSYSHGSVSDVSGLLSKSFKNPLKPKSKLNKMSIAPPDETNDSSSVSETDTEAFCGRLANAQLASTPKTSHSTSTTKEVENSYVIASAALQPTELRQDQNDLRIHYDIRTKVPTIQEFIRETVENVDTSEKSPKSLSACRSNRPSNNSLISKDLSVSKHKNTPPIVEVSSSPRTRKDFDEPLSPDGNKTLKDGKPITTEKGRSTDRFSGSSETKNENKTECHSGPAAKDSATNDATNRILLLPSNLNNIENGRTSDLPSSSQDAELPTSGRHTSDDDVTVGAEIAVTNITPNVVDEGKCDGIIRNGHNIDQLRSSVDPPITALSNIRKPSPSVGPSPILDDQAPSILDASHHTVPTVELVNHPTAVSPGIAIPNEPNSVNFHEKHASHHGVDEGKVDDNANSVPSTTHTVQTTATSLHLHLTTFDIEAGDATDIKSRCSVTHLSPAREVVLPLEQPVSKNSSGANRLIATKETNKKLNSTSSQTDRNTVSSLASGHYVVASEGRGKQLDKAAGDVIKIVSVGEAKIDNTCQPHHDVTTLGTKHLSRHEVSSVSELQQTVCHNTLASGKPVSLCDAPTSDEKKLDENNIDALITHTLAPKPAPESVENASLNKQRNEDEPKPYNSIPKVGPIGLLVSDEQPEPRVPRQAKRKSVSFKPHTENLYHSPPDHGSFEYQDQNADGRTEEDNGNEFSRIQMTTDISEIQPALGAKRVKKHFSSTPISKPKKTSPSKMSVQPQSLASAELTKHQFLIPPALPVTKRVSIQPVLEIITPLVPDPQGKPVPMAAGGQGSSGNDSGSSGYELPSENFLEISAIPKDVSASKWGGNAPLFHSTPLHRTRASIKKHKKKSEQPPGVPQSTTSEEQAEARVVNHSVQTSHNLRSRSKTSLESGSASEPLSQSTSGSLRRSARRNPTPAATAPQTPQAGGNEPGDRELVIGSPANRIAIQDNTIVSTRIESQSRTRGSRTRSTSGSTFKSYDSHRKMTSRRLFNNVGESKSSADAGYPSGETESLPPTSVPPTSNDVASTSSQEDDVLSSPAESSIARSYPPSIVHNDENISAMAGQQNEDYSDNESVISGVSTGSSSSAPVDNGVVMRQSFESQLSSLRYRSKRHSKERAGSHHQAEPPKPRSKFAIKRGVPASDLDLIFPIDVPVRKRKRNQSAAAKLFNPGAKWKKSKQLYAWLKKKLEPEYKLHTNLESERLVLELDHARILVSQGHKQGALDLCIERLVRLKICSNQIQLWGFFMKFMPDDFIREVVPMGGAFGKPFDKDHPIYPYDPIELPS